MFIKKITLIFNTNLHDSHIGTFDIKWKLNQPNGAIGNGELHAPSEVQMRGTCPHDIDLMED